jgi:hypothetical protein
VSIRLYEPAPQSCAVAGARRDDHCHGGRGSTKSLSNCLSYLASVRRAGFGLFLGR